LKNSELAEISLRKPTLSWAASRKIHPIPDLNLPLGH